VDGVFAAAGVPDDPEHTYVTVGSVNFHSNIDSCTTSVYQSLRGTSKMETVHSVLDKTRLIPNMALELQYLTRVLGSGSATTDVGLKG